MIGQAKRIPVTPHRVLALSGDLLGHGELADRASPAAPAFPLRVGPFDIGIEPGVEQDQKNPLRPAHVFRIGGRELALPVVAEAQTLDLPPDIGYVALGCDPGVGSRFDSILLGRQAKGVVAHGVQDVVTSHALKTAIHVGGGVSYRVSDVKPFAGWVGKHVEHVQLGLGAIIRRAEGLVLLPVFLPPGLDIVRVVNRHRFPRNWNIATEPGRRKPVSGYKDYSDGAKMQSFPGR